MKKCSLDNKTSKAVNDEDEWSARFISVSNIRQICAEICSMLLDCVVGNDFERPLVDNIGIVAPSRYSCVWNARVVICKKILRPETCVLLSWISRPGSLAIASQTVNENDAALSSATSKMEGSEARTRPQPRLSHAES